MAVYKVAQDVEAEDKLLGPFSFRQFVYLIVTVMSAAVAFGLSKLFLPLAILPLPVIIVFGALALPLRKDQPMETYLGALISFFLKPRKRLWQPDGVEHIIEITAPRTDDVQRTKDLSRTEAQRRLAYLADLADSRGWSIRHSTMPGEQIASSMVGDVYNEAQQAEDILGNEGDVALAFDTMIGQADQKRRQAAIERMSTPLQPVAATQPIQPQPQANPTLQQPQVTIQNQPQSVSQTPLVPISTTPDLTLAAPIHYDPYPNMRQSMINPVGEEPITAPQPQPTSQVQPAPQAPAQPTPQTPSASTSVTPPSADILDLANNTDLSIETIANEANRRSKKALDDEVVISLR